MSEAASNPSTGRDSGFTMLELLVALALFALLLAALPATLQMGRRAAQTATALDRTAADTVAIGFVRERIAEALPLMQRDDKGALRIAFRGEANSLTFVSPVVDGPMGSGLFLAELGSRAVNEDHAALVMAWRPFTPVANATALSSERVLIPDISQFAIRYFGYQAGNGRREWSERWADNRELPELVELSMTSPGATGLEHRVVVAITQRDVP